MATIFYTVTKPERSSIIINRFVTSFNQIFKYLENGMKFLSKILHKIILVYVYTK